MKLSKHLNKRLNVEIVPALDDNYFFILTCVETGELAVVDPGSADEIINKLNGRIIDKILLTHHHHDHVGGVQELVNKYQCKVYGFEGDVHRLPYLTNLLNNNDTVQVGVCEAQVLFLPGHTNGHIAYYFAEENMLFSGDVLFVGGCGRLFEGSFDYMFNSLVKLKALPPETLVFCAHEYTLSNLEFALSVEPENAQIAQSLANFRQVRKQGLPTIPTTIGAEISHNIFLQTTSVQAFARLRQLKDNFSL